MTIRLSITKNTPPAPTHEQRQFNNFAECESFLGEFIRRTDVSHDGRIHIEPLDEFTRESLASYRHAFQSKDACPELPDRLPIGISLSDQDKQLLSNNTCVPSGSYRWLLRGKETIDNVTPALFRTDTDDPDRIYCKRQTAVVIDHHYEVAVVVDQRYRATAIEHLLLRAYDPCETFIVHPYGEGEDAKFSQAVGEKNAMLQMIRMIIEKKNAWRMKFSPAIEPYV